MARYAIVEAGVVVNVIEADEEFAATLDGIASDTAAPGDTWDGQTFSRPAPPAPPVPDEVDRWKAHYVLAAAGHMPAVRAAIAAIADDTQRAVAEALFDQRPTIRRLSTLTQQIQQAVGINDAERDALFVQAFALQD